MSKNIYKAALKNYHFTTYSARVRFGIAEAEYANAKEDHNVTILKARSDYYAALDPDAQEES